MTTSPTSINDNRKPSATPILIASAATLLLVLVLLVAHQGSLVRVAIPAGVASVGLALYLRRPIGYIHFVFWVYFLTPLVRRLVDWQVGFADENLVLLAPILVSAIAVITLARERHAVSVKDLTPFVLCVAPLLYGFAVAFVRLSLHASAGASPGEIAYALLDWLSPLLFGLHLCLRWKTSHLHKRAVYSIFLWAVLLLGSYGIWQFVAPPIWDKYWLEQLLAQLGETSFGFPRPFEVRIWSTSNSPASFANILMTGLLLFFSAESKLKPLANSVGYSALLITQIRTSWLGWLAGLLVLAKTSRGGQIPRLLFSLLLLPVLVAPLMLVPQISDVVTQRLASFQNGGRDESFQDRAQEYVVFASALAEDPFGEGLSNANYFHGLVMDSGLVHLLYACGWIGAAFFVSGIALCGMQMSSGIMAADPFVSACRAIFIAMILELLSANIFAGMSGLILWTCIGLSLGLRQGVKYSRSANDYIKDSPEDQFRGFLGDKVNDPRRNIA